MAKYPDALWLPLPENKTARWIDPDKLITHTAVDQPGPTDLHRYFARLDIGAESTFWLPKGKYKKPIVQMMDTNRQANTNRAADFTAISVETEDEGNPEREPWDDWQLEQLIQLHLWVVEAHPKVVPGICPTPTSAGFAFHSLFGFRDPRNKIGLIRNPWTYAQGKTCPGKTRTIQWYDVVVPEVLRRLENPQPTHILTPAVIDVLRPFNGGPWEAEIVDTLNDPIAGGAWIALRNGGIITAGSARYLGSAHEPETAKHWKDRHAAGLRAWNDETRSVVPRPLLPDGRLGTPTEPYHRYLIVSTAAEEYGHDRLE